MRQHTNTKDLTPFLSVAKKASLVLTTSTRTELRTLL